MLLLLLLLILMLCRLLSGLAMTSKRNRAWLMLKLNRSTMCESDIDTGCASSTLLLLQFQQHRAATMAFIAIQQ